MWCAAIAAMIVMLINASVWFFGGSPRLWSLFHLKDKVHALGKMASHMPGHLFDGCQDDLRPVLVAAATRHRVPADFVLAVARAESGTASHRISHAGAMGVLQLMPGTASDLRVNDPFDPYENIDGGVRYMRYLWRRYDGDRTRVAAAYNCGPGCVPRSGKLVLPSETRAYVRKVLGS